MPLAHSPRAPLDILHPRAWAICDRCGFQYLHSALVGSSTGEATPCPTSAFSCAILAMTRRNPTAAGPSSSDPIPFRFAIPVQALLRHSSRVACQGLGGSQRCLRAPSFWTRRSSAFWMWTRWADMTVPVVFLAGQILRASELNADFSSVAGDIVNVLSYGADPTGQNDSSAAVNAALATGKSVYVPTGTYLLNHQIIVGVNGNTAQCMRGDGKSSIFLINQNFDPTASSVVLMNGAEQNAVTITDLLFVCAQGANVNDRSTFLTLAQGGNLTTGIKYPPIILWGNGCNRFRLERLQFDNVWDGIQQIHNSNSGGWWIRDIEMGCYNIGLLVSNTQDFTICTAGIIGYLGYPSLIGQYG